MEREIITQGTEGSFESKPLEPFYNWKTAPTGTELDGRYIGTYDSKASGNPFAVFERTDGTRFAAWLCTALKFKIQDLLDKEKEMNLPQGTLYMTTKFLGKLDGKKSYSFTRPTIYKVSGTVEVSAAKSPIISTDEIPF